MQDDVMFKKSLIGVDGREFKLHYKFGILDSYMSILEGILKYY